MTSSRISAMKRRLIDGHLSLLLATPAGEVHTFTSRGVADLYRLHTTAPALLCGAVIVDKVVGTGAAALMALGGVERVHALVISEKALRLLFCSGVDVTYDRLVPAIVNRAGTGQCPLEARLRPYTRPAAMLPVIRDFVAPLPSAELPPR